MHRRNSVAVKILCVLLLLAYSSPITAHDKPKPPPVVVTDTSDRNDKLMPFLLGAVLVSVLVVTFGKEPKQEPLLKIKSQPGDDR